MFIIVKNEEFFLCDSNNKLKYLGKNIHSITYKDDILGYIYGENKRNYVKIGENIYGPFQYIDSYGINKDKKKNYILYNVGGEVYYEIVGGKWYLQIGDKHYGGYDKIYPPIINDYHFWFKFKNKDDYTYFNLDDKIYPCLHDTDEIYYRNEKKTVFFRYRDISEKKSDKQIIKIDNKIFFDKSYYSSYSVSDNGKHFYFIYEEFHKDAVRGGIKYEGNQYVLDILEIDGVKFGEYEIVKCNFDSENKLYLYYLKNGFLYIEKTILN